MLRLAVLLCLLLPASASAAPRKVPQGWLGVVADGPLTAPGFPQREWDLLAGSGAESVRTGFFWTEIQPSGPGDADFSRTDPVVVAPEPTRPPGVKAPGRAAAGRRATRVRSWQPRQKVCSRWQLWQLGSFRRAAVG